MLNFRLTENILRGGYGFVGVSISNIPSFPEHSIHNVVKLESPWPDYALDVHMFDFDQTKSDFPKLSIQSNVASKEKGCGKSQKFGGIGTNCGIFFNGSIDGQKEENQITHNFKKHDRTLSRLSKGMRWTRTFNNFVARRGKPISLITNIYKDGEEDCILMGYSLSNWMPHHLPSISEIVENCDFLISSQNIRISEFGYSLLILSDGETIPVKTGTHAYWEIPKVVVHQDSN